MNAAHLGHSSQGRFLSKFRTLCAHYPRTAGFIPPQRRHVPEHRNNSNAFAHTTLKRHECRAPLTRFKNSTGNGIRSRNSLKSSRLPGKVIWRGQLNKLIICEKELATPGPLPELHGISRQAVFGILEAFGVRFPLSRFPVLNHRAGCRVQIRQVWCS